MSNTFLQLWKNTFMKKRFMETSIINNVMGLTLGISLFWSLETGLKYNATIISEYLFATWLTKNQVVFYKETFNEESF